MVIGLAPPFFLLGLTDLRGKGRKYPLCFHLSFWCGLIIGVVQGTCILSMNLRIVVAKKLPTSWNISTGDYANLLGANIYGSLLCIGFFLVGLLFPDDILYWPYYRFLRCIILDMSTYCLIGIARRTYNLHFVKLLNKGSGVIGANDLRMYSKLSVGLYQHPSWTLLIGNGSSIFG